MDFSVINEDNYGELLNYMQSLADDKYREFHSRLVPNIGKFMGIRVPLMRKLGKEISKGDRDGFLRVCGAEFYEEIMLKGLVIANLKLDYDKFTQYVDGYLPYVNNWAICDIFCSSLKLVKKYRPQFFEHLDGYLNSGTCWTMRVGIILMLSYYLEDEYIDRVLERCGRIKSDEYYVNMGNAWLIATAYAKYPEKTKNFLLTEKLDDETFKMTVRKCIESTRIPKEEKDYLRSLKKRI